MSGLSYLEILKDTITKHRLSLIPLECLSPKTQPIRSINFDDAQYICYDSTWIDKQLPVIIKDFYFTPYEDFVAQNKRSPSPPEGEESIWDNYGPPDSRLEHYIKLFTKQIIKAVGNQHEKVIGVVVYPTDDQQRFSLVFESVKKPPPSPSPSSSSSSSSPLTSVSMSSSSSSVSSEAKMPPFVPICAPPNIPNRPYELSLVIHRNMTEEDINRLIFHPPSPPPIPPVVPLPDPSPEPFQPPSPPSPPRVASSAMDNI